MVLRTKNATMWNLWSEDVTSSWWEHGRRQLLKCCLFQLYMMLYMMLYMTLKTAAFQQNEILCKAFNVGGIKSTYVHGGWFYFCRSATLRLSFSFVSKLTSNYASILSLVLFRLPPIPSHLSAIPRWAS